MGETLFGIPIKEVRRQLGTRQGHDVDPKSSLQPMNPEYGKSVGILDSCISGAKKILEDPEQTERIRKILRK